ncbi:hypothetical protein KW782_04295 [Candidatus Parcubacteria bacterium]|nr:hypothetical protein [Candidatus Parcubacteria bacterium]
MTEKINLNPDQNFPEQQERMPFVEKYFKGTTPEEKIAEIYAFAEELGLKPHQALVRIFNGGLIDVMKNNGTDRAGIDEVDTRRYEGVDFGYTDKLRSLNLRLDDGLYAMPLSQFAPVFSKGLFERETISIPSHRTAIAIYNGDLLLDVVDDEPASGRPARNEAAGEFYYFKHPKNKLEALAGIISQEPLEIEREFNKFPDNETKINYIKGLIHTIDRANASIIKELILDVRREILHKANNQPEDVNLKSQSHEINELAAYCLEREHQFGFIDEFRDQVQIIKEKGKEVRDTSVEFILQNINEELANAAITDIYRQELLNLAEEVKNL